MTAELSVETLQKRVQNSELGREITDNLLMNQDIWSLTTLGYSEQECRISGHRYLYFTKFSLPWLKLLAQLTTKAGVREGHSIGRVAIVVNTLKQLDEFLIEVGCTQPQTITDLLLQQFIDKSNSKQRRTTIFYAATLWAEEQWLKLSYTPRRAKQPNPKIETIPEFVLYQVYEKFDLFPPPLERLFRLQLVLGCRIGEMLTMPRQCLKLEGNHWFLLRWVQKRKHWRFERIHPLVAELVQEQQRFLNNQFGEHCHFEKLFCKTSAAVMDGAKVGGRFQVEPVYSPKIMTYSSIHDWLKSFSNENYNNLTILLGKSY